MSFASGLKGISKKLIDKYGNDIILKVTTLGTGFDPVTFLPIGDVLTTYNTKGVEEDYISERTTSGDLKITFYLDTDIQNLDSIIASGTDRTVLSLRKISSQNVVIIYEAVLSGDGLVQVT